MDISLFGQLHMNACRQNGRIGSFIMSRKPEAAVAIFNKKPRPSRVVSTKIAYKTPAVFYRIEEKNHSLRRVLVRKLFL